MRKFGILCLSLLMLLGLTVAPAVHAQDEMAKVTCDSTLVSLLLIAEYEYGYLSDMMAMEDMTTPELEKGQYAPLFDSIMMMEGEEEMMEEGDMAAHDEMLDMYMGMDTAAMMAGYAESMGMEMGEGDMMVTLTPGNVEGEDAVCAQLRTSVEQFLLAHFLTEMSMMSMDEG